MMVSRRRTTLKDVAEDVGVHVSTVSRALNPDTRHFIRPEVAERILAASERLNYRPNAAAYSLRTNKTRIVGVVIPDIANPVFPPIIRGIEDVLSERGYLAILVNSEPRDARHGETIGALQSRGVDGLITASLERSDPILRSLVDEGLPIVTVNRRVEDMDVPSVTHDEDQGMHLILEHLRELGHTRVTHIAGPQTISTGKARHEAFQRHAQLLGFDTSQELVVFADGLTEPDGERCAGLLLDTVSRSTAIVTSNDLLAVGALTMLRRRGIACPAQMAVTGFNDMPMVDRFEPPLTTIRVQQYEVGRLAAQLLFKRLDRVELSEAERHIVKSVELVVRGSTAGARRPSTVAG